MAAQLQLPHSNPQLLSCPRSWQQTQLHRRRHFAKSFRNNSCLSSCLTAITAAKLPQLAADTASPPPFYLFPPRKQEQLIVKLPKRLLTQFHRRHFVFLISSSLQLHYFLL
jgi:hypothetical protein